MGFGSVIIGIDVNAIGVFYDRTLCARNTRPSSLGKCFTFAQQCCKRGALIVRNNSSIRRPVRQLILGNAILASRTPLDALSNFCFLSSWMPRGRGLRRCTSSSFTLASSVVCRSLLPASCVKLEIHQPMQKVQQENPEHFLITIQTNPSVGCQRHFLPRTEYSALLRTPSLMQPSIVRCNVQLDTEQTSQWRYRRSQSLSARNAEFRSLRKVNGCTVRNDRPGILNWQGVNEQSNWE